MPIGPEDRARLKIDGLLEDAGWVIQDMNNFNLSAGLGVAIREFPVKSGFADYMLFVDKTAVGAIEAKPVGTTLGGVSEQSEKYITDFPDDIPHIQTPLPFAYDSTGQETYFRDERDPEPRSRRIFAFHTPASLHQRLKDEQTLRRRLQNLPELDVTGLWDIQVEAITNLEESLRNNHPRALVQMATGSGKTFTAVNLVYRLVKFAKARRVLFLVDRNNLGKQTFKEFQQFVTPDDGRKFTQIYNTQHLNSNSIDGVSRVCISTIQRLYSMLKGEELDPESDEVSAFELNLDAEGEDIIRYNPNIPIGTFDFIITDECHRSIYNLWRQVLEYFDAFLIGLTATPSKQTLGFFNQNLVTEYPHERAVADGVNVGYEVYRIRTEITEAGSTVEAGSYVDRRDKLTREERWELLDEPLDYEARQLDRSVVAKDQIRTVLRTFKERLFTEIFPGRTEVPKTLIFAKDDSHAEDILHIAREVFEKGNEFCKKITYRSAEDPDTLIRNFRNEYNPRIAVSVDMISTGTDIKPIECLIFMRDVKSRTYFEQMKGRGTRTLQKDDLQNVTPDARTNKTHFVIVDAVGVCESDKTDSRPFERQKSVAFNSLLQSVALGNRSEDNLSSLAGRLARLDQQLEDEDKETLRNLAEGKTLQHITNDLLDAINPDSQLERAKELFETDSPSEEQQTKVQERLSREACGVFSDAGFRNKLIEIKQRNEQVIDTVSQDQVIDAGYDANAREQAEQVIHSFQEFLQDNRDEITALQLLYNIPYGQRHLTFEQIKELASALRNPPYQLDNTLLWHAYEQLERSRVQNSTPEHILTDIVSLVRFAIGETDTLKPFKSEVEERFNEWLTQQEASGREFTAEQKEWLEMIKNHIATSLSITPDDLQDIPFLNRGGIIHAQQVFGDELEPMLDELNEVLAA